MPSAGGSRSFTNDPGNSSNSGIEIGKDYENNVNEVLIVLAAADKVDAPEGKQKFAKYGYIASSMVSSNNIFKANASASTGGNPIYEAKASFTKGDIATYYYDANDEANASQVKGDVAVFLFVNPSGNIITELSKEGIIGTNDWLNTKGEVLVNGDQTEGAIWSTHGKGNFLMSNAEIAVRKLPASLDDWSYFATGTEKKFELSGPNADFDGMPDNSSTADDKKGGPVKVERTTARFDFRDGSGDDTDPNTYHVLYDKNDDGTRGDAVVNIKLNKMCLVNMNKSFYYLRRTSDDGKNLETTFDLAPTDKKWSICGVEKPWFSDEKGTLLGTPGNYVVDAIANEKLSANKNMHQYMNYPFFKNDGTTDDEEIEIGNSNWYVSNIATVLGGEKDQWENTNKKGDYFIWRYVTENTIPAPGSQDSYDDVEVNGASTGVVFKGKMLIDASQEAYSEDALAELLEKKDGSYENALARNELIKVLSTDPNKAVEAEDPVLYKIAGELYATWEYVRQVAISKSFSWTYNADKTDIVVDWKRDNTLYRAVFGNGTTGHTFDYEVRDPEDSTKPNIKKTYVDGTNSDLDTNSPDYLWSVWNNDKKGEGAEEALAAFRKAATGNKITIYQASKDATDGWGYYCYYYYWNRHNDNGNDGVPGPMEFCVVRNNVYKLAVTSISQLGHPRIFANDPDAPTPDTPDEKEDIYITVQSEVLPWVVRENNIKF